MSPHTTTLRHCFIRFLIPLALLGGSACSSDDPGFYDECETASDCAAGWRCPSSTDVSGGIEGVCTPECATDSDCVDETGRSDAFCNIGICMWQCSSDADCPDSQSECRGADATCSGILTPPFWCARPEGFICT